MTEMKYYSLINLSFLEGEERLYYFDATTCHLCYTQLFFSVHYLLSGSLTTSHWFNPLSAKLTKWPNTLKKFVGNLPTNCLSVFGHFVKFALKGLSIVINEK